MVLLNHTAIESCCPNRLPGFRLKANFCVVLHRYIGRAFEWKPRIQDNDNEKKAMNNLNLSRRDVLVGVSAMAIASIAKAKSTDIISTSTARQTPVWIRRGILYQIWLRGFTPEGTLSAATKHLAHIAELGATVVYLSPVYLQDDDRRVEFWSVRQRASGFSNPRNPYRIKDYDRIDPEYGTEDDLRRFIEAAHSVGLKVLMDVVFLHCGPNSTLRDRAGFIKRDKSGNFATNSYNFLLLNFENQDLRNYLIANLTHWVEKCSVDGFRCDVADGIPLDFWEEARTNLSRLDPDLVMLAEGERGEDQRYAFDMNYTFKWWDSVYNVVLKGKPASSLQLAWEANNNEHPKGARLLRYVENHDKANDYGRADSAYGERAATLWTIMNFMLDGVPMIYNGQEFADASPQSIFGKLSLDWNSSGLPIAKKRFALYQTLCRLRRNEQTLSEGLVTWVPNDQPEFVVSFVRKTAAEEILTVLNFSNQSVRVVISRKGTFGQVVLSEDARVIESGEKSALAIEATGYMVTKYAVGA